MESVGNKNIFFDVQIPPSLCPAEDIQLQLKSAALQRKGLLNANKDDKRK